MKEPKVARESNVKALNAVASQVGSRKDAAIREFAIRRMKYEEQLKEYEKIYNYAESNRDKYAAEKAIELLNFRIREMDSNIAYIRRFS